MSEENEITENMFDDETQQMFKSIDKALETYEKFNVKAKPLLMEDLVDMSNEQIAEMLSTDPDFRTRNIGEIRDVHIVDGKICYKATITIFD